MNVSILCLVYTHLKVSLCFVSPSSLALISVSVSALSLPHFSYMVSEQVYPGSPHPCLKLQLTSTCFNSPQLSASTSALFTSSSMFLSSWLLYFTLTTIFSSWQLIFSFKVWHNSSWQLIFSSWLPSFSSTSFYISLPSVLGLRPISQLVIAFICCSLSSWSSQHTFRFLLPQFQQLVHSLHGCTTPWIYLTYGQNQLDTLLRFWILIGSCYAVVFSHGTAPSSLVYQAAPGSANFEVWMLFV